MENQPDPIIYNIGQMLTIRGVTQKPKTSWQMDDSGIIEDGAVAIKEGQFFYVSNTEEIMDRYDSGTIKTINA